MEGDSLSEWGHFGCFMNSLYCVQTHWPMSAFTRFTAKSEMGDIAASSLVTKLVKVINAPVAHIRAGAIIALQLAQTTLEVCLIGEARSSGEKREGLLECCSITQ